jgi:hypothetical protein
MPAIVVNATRLNPSVEQNSMYNIILSYFVRQHKNKILNAINNMKNNSYILIDDIILSKTDLRYSYSLIRALHNDINNEWQRPRSIDFDNSYYILLIENIETNKHVYRRFKQLIYSLRVLANSLRHQHKIGECGLRYVYRLIDDIINDVKYRLINECGIYNPKDSGEKPIE